MTPHEHPHKRTDQRTERERDPQFHGPKLRGFALIRTQPRPSFLRLALVVELVDTLS